MPVRWLPFLAALTFAPALPPAVAASAELAQAASPFLRTHAGSAVDWQPWGPAAFARAQQEGRPLYVAIGASQSELSSAMHRQTFANPDIAAFLNTNFVCVLVDREELPALAAQGQAYVRAVKQLSGWPLNLWLTPELQPFDGATYLPPSEEWGKEGFLNVAQRVAAAWRADPAAARAAAEEAIATIREFESPLKLERFRVGEVRTSLQGSAEAWRSQSDAERGGFGETPRHAESEMLRFLLRAGGEARAAAVANLHALLRSGLRDPIDGGFFRYTSDEQARLPYFQKRLNDQARLVLALLEAHAIAPEPAFEAAARGALDYVLTRLVSPTGTFVAGEDATAPRAATYYTWRDAELLEILGRSQGAAVAATYGAKPDGNISPNDDPGSVFLGLNLLAGPPDLKFRDALAKLRAARDQRPSPARDETVVAYDQGLILLALARAGHALNEPRFTTAARSLATAIERDFVHDGDQLRRLVGSEAPAGPEDYAAIALGLRALDTAETSARALRLLQQADAQFLDAPNGVLYTTGAELPPGAWLRLPAPASNPGDPPAAAPLRLLAGDPLPETLGARLAAQHRDASLPATGDLLLALRHYVDLLP